MDNYLGLRVLISRLIHTICESSRLNADKNANHSFKKKKKCKQANGITSALCIYCTDRKSKRALLVHRKTTNSALGMCPRPKGSKENILFSEVGVDWCLRSYVGISMFSFDVCASGVF